MLGVEISPAHSELARSRIAKNQWKNVEVVQAAAADVTLNGTFAGLMMFAAPDVYASEDALANLLQYLKDDARIAAFGAKLSTEGFGKFLNPFLKLLCKMSFSTTPRPDYEPWRILAQHVEGLEVEEYFFGLMFLASGSAVTSKNHH